MCEKNPCVRKQSLVTVSLKLHNTGKERKEKRFECFTTPRAATKEKATRSVIPLNTPVEQLVGHASLLKMTTATTKTVRVANARNIKSVLTNKKVRLRGCMCRAVICILGVGGGGGGGLEKEKKISFWTRESGEGKFLCI